MYWDTLKYGWVPCYWLTVAGVPVVWIEKATGKTLPAGFTAEDASLVVDASSEVGADLDRERGIGVGLPFGFKILDTATARLWVRKPAKSMNLTVDATAGALSFTVDSTAGWAPGDVLWLGNERILVDTVPDATHFTTLARGGSESAGAPASKHRAGAVGQLLTDKPRTWKGRDVVLWAAPCTPTGYVTGANLDSDAIQVWKGRIEDGPERVADGFVFQARSLDRVLDDPLVARLTGTVDSQQNLYQVQSGWTFKTGIQGFTAVNVSIFDASIKIQPFTATASGTLMSSEEMRAAISAAWTTAVAAAGFAANLGELVWVPATKAGLGPGVFELHVVIKLDATLYSAYQYGAQVNGAFLLSAPQVGKSYPGGMTKDDLWPVYVYVARNPLIPFAFSEYDGFTPNSPPLDAVTVDLDGAANPGDVPSSGLFRVTSGPAKGQIWKYSAAQTYGAGVYLTGLEPAGPGAGSQGSAALAKASVEILFGSTGRLDQLCLRAVESSGTAALRGAYDTLPQGAGYSVNDAHVHEDSFVKLLSAGGLSQLQATVTTAGQGFVGGFGGALALFRRAVVCRPDKSVTARTLKLTCIRTQVGGDYQETVADADLLSLDSEPLEPVRRLESPNRIKVVRVVDGEGEGQDIFFFADVASVEATGAREVEYRVPCDSRPILFAVATGAAAAAFAVDQHVQAVTLRVPPWVDVDVGDGVKLALTHPALWSWASATPGLTGIARVVGRRMNLRTQQTALVVLCDANVNVRALSPAAEILAFAGPAAAPTSLDVHLKYFDHFDKTLTDAAGNFWVVHFKPGRAETDAERHEISAVVVTGGVCRLTVANTVGGHSIVLADKSTLTLPTTNFVSVTTYQKEYFAHVDDGSKWG